MNLTHGYRLAVAPFFHQSIDWSSRLLVGDGVEEEQGRFVARPPWRAPTADELAALAIDGAPAKREDLDACLCLFALPEHLQTAWWDMLDRAGPAGTTHLEGFDAFVQEVASLLAFKELPVPNGATFELVASQPGQRSICWTFDRWPSAPWPPSPEQRPARLWGAINLGNEALSVVLVNLVAQQMHDMLAQRFPALPAPCTYGELAACFLTHLADYPPIRLRLEPGEGYRLPAGGILVDACTLGTQEPAVLLLISDRGEEGS
ncbi:MAG TPA: hypothetical protein VKE98_04880 [Gemmataceae bacterium]|nr:hypothetical protein [Gemmataceae bacterium]